MCFQLESEGKEESTTRGASLRAENKKRELLCIAWGRERLPHTEIGADGKGKVCPRSDTEERRERQRHSRASIPCALRYWKENKQGAMLKHYPTFLDSTLV